MNASTPYSLPNGGNLPNVTAPYNPQAGIYMSCESAATQNLIAGNMYVGVDANHVYTYASTAFPTGLMWPSLWMSYVWRQVSGPAPPYPAVADARLGNATKAELQSSSFSVSAGQTYTHTTKHGVISGCVSPPPSETPYIVSTQTKSASITTQIITTSPPGLSLSVDGSGCGGTCTYYWLTGTRHSLSAPISQNLGGVQYQFGTWSNGGTATHSYDTPGASAHLTASYALAGGGALPLTVTSIVSPIAGGTITPPSGSYYSGTVLTLLATPTSGRVFDSWTMFNVFGTTTSRANPMFLTVNAATKVVATFRSASDPVLGCVVSSNPVVTGTPVTLAATVSEGFNPGPYTWTGYVTGTGPSVQFTPSQPGGYFTSVTAGGKTALCFVAVADPALDSLRTFLGGTGEGSYTIPPGTHIVPPQYGTKSSTTDPVYTSTYLRIARSNITISGASISGATDTILKRGTWFTGGLSAPWPPIVQPEFMMDTMATEPPVGNVIIRDLMFDGNRYAPGLNCLPGNSPFYDLDVSLGGKFTLEGLHFVNAPGDAVFLAGTNSSISLSTFGQYWEPRTATRTTAITLRGASNTAALFNTVLYAGTAGIRIEGSGNVAYGNSLLSNRYELSDYIPELDDGGGGGQLYLKGGSTGAIVAGNVINGESWPPPNSANLELATGCRLPPTQQYNSGIEGYGFDHSFFNNEVVAHTGTGMQFAGSNPTGRITISSAPFDISDWPRRFVENNGDGGIVFLGKHWCSEHKYFKAHMDECGIADGVLLDGVFVADNENGSISLDVTSTVLVPNARVIDKTTYALAPFQGFFNGACISGNTGSGDNVVLKGQSLIWPFLANPRPSTISAYLPWFNLPPAYPVSPQPCPAPPWPSSSPPPAPSRPGWPW